MESGEDKVPVPETLGREKCVNNLLLKLDDDDLDLRVISVVDVEATGKTALARSVYGSVEVKRSFAYRAWIRVRDNFSVGDVLVNILRQISTRDLKDVDQAKATTKLSLWLQAYFFQQRYLLVLDNMNRVDLLAKLLTFLIDSSKGSRVIITTRNVKLPDLIYPGVDPITIHPLSTEDRKSLLLLWSSESDPARWHHLIPTILRQCSLSPAGIRLLGGLLSLKQMNEQSVAIIGRLAENPSLKDIVSLCYETLSCPSKHCIMYVCQFPREYEIPTRRLLRLWLADSHVLGPERGIQEAEKRFQDLVDRNMIHVVSHGKGHVFAKTCCMPGYIYDFLLRKALDEGFLRLTALKALQICQSLLPRELSWMNLTSLTEQKNPWRCRSNPIENGTMSKDSVLHIIRYQED